jgi:UDP-N-acetylmuramoyl-tripeptide--D-alanyl-D-alanine ligase
MEPLDLAEVIARSGGLWAGPSAPPVARVLEIGTDTRALGAQAVFVALAGERFDGHSFLRQAKERGAVASVVRGDRLAGLPADAGPYIAVGDPLEALENLARANRDRLRARVVAVTGSVGKTSTKDFIATIAAGAFRVQSSRKSFNNRIGLALTLLDAGPEAEVLVVELGTSGAGELSHLSRIARPDAVVLTEIAPAHIAGFGDLAGVVAAKAEIFDGLAPGGAAFIRHGVTGFAVFAPRATGPVRTFGWNEGDHAVTDCRRVRLDSARNGNSAADYGYHFTLNGAENFLLPVPGRHNVLNAAAAIAVARHLGMAWEDIRPALANCRLPPLRFQVTEAGGVVIVDDTYNASPRSVEAAIDEWASLANGSKGRRPGECLVAVFGDMLELGDSSRAAHEAVGKRLAGLGARLVVTVGDESRSIADLVRGGGGEAIHFASAESAVPYLRENLRRGDHVLFKGSRRVGLDVAAKELRQWLAEVPP